VSIEVIAQLAVGERPDLDKLVPTARDDKGDGLRRAEANAGDPLRVSLVLVTSDGVLALSQRIPKLDGLITGSTDDLTVVNAEGDREDILAVSAEATGGLSAVNLPEAEGSVPRSTESELAVRGDHNIGDEVGVSTEGTTGASKGSRSIGGGASEAPDHDGLVAGGREDHVGVLSGGGDAGDPVAMSLEGSTEG